MREPFINTSVYNNRDIPNFRASSFPACHYQRVLKEKYNKPLSNTTLEAFETGSDIHAQVESLQDGSKEIIGSEKSMKIIHVDKTFTISGHYDFLKFDYNGRYLEDLKTAKQNSFYFFLKEPISDDYKLQLSIYSYINFIEEGYYINDAVITKIDKSNPRNRLSKSFKLYTKQETRKLILDNPYIRFILGSIDENDLKSETIKQIRENKWKCSYCEYKKECEVFTLLEYPPKEPTKPITVLP